MEIRDVWADNLAEEMAKIRKVVERYPYIGMDTEFPGVVSKPMGSFRSNGEFAYQMLRCNVDMLKIIQIGLCFCDEQGNLPEGTHTWQFNFRFDLTADMYAPDSIDLLTTAGIDFQNHLEHGIDPDDFAELLISSGLVLSDDVRWISYHSGYDFGYLFKILNCVPLPASEKEFFDLLHIWFPCYYDIKFLMKNCKNLKGGLQEVADDLGVERIGTQHQAGSDAHATAASFFRMRTRFFDDKVDDARFARVLFGLGPNTVQHHTSRFGNGASNVLQAANMVMQAPGAGGAATATSASVSSGSYVFSGASARATPPLQESHAIQIRPPTALNGFGTPPPASRAAA